MSIGSLIDERFAAVESSLSDATAKVAEFLEDLSNINRNVDDLPINVSVEKVEGPTEINRYAPDISVSEALEVTPLEKTEIDAPTLPDMTDYQNILTVIKNLAFAPYDKYNPAILRDIDFTIGSPELLGEVPIKTAPDDISISDLTTYSFDTILVPEAVSILPDLSIEDIDPLNDTLENYFDPDLTSMMNDLLAMLDSLSAFFDTVKGDNSLNEWLQKIEDRHLDQADSWVETELSTELDVIPVTSFAKKNPMPTPIVATSIKNNIVAELFGKSRAEVFEFIEAEKDKNETMQYEALISVHKGFFDSYLSLLKHQYTLANGLWEIAILKYKASLDIRKFEISIHEAMIATIEEYLTAYQEGQRAYQSQLSYNKAFVELSNAALSKIQNEVSLYRTNVDIYKAKISEIDSQIKLSSAKVKAFANKVEEKMAYVKENTAKYEANQNFISLIADELESDKVIMDSERLASEIELLRDTMNSDTIEYMLANISSTRNQALTRVKMEAQQADIRTLGIENAFKKLRSIEERYNTKIEQMKSQYVLAANSWGFSEASSGIRTNVRTVGEVIDSIAQIALTGYEPLAALAAGMANTVDAMVSGVYEGITNL